MGPFTLRLNGLYLKKPSKASYIFSEPMKKNDLDLSALSATFKFVVNYTHFPNSANSWILSGDILPQDRRDDHNKMKNGRVHSLHIVCVRRKDKDNKTPQNWKISKEILSEKFCIQTTEKQDHKKPLFDTG